MNLNKIIQPLREEISVLSSEIATMRSQKESGELSLHAGIVLSCDESMLSRIMKVHGMCLREIEKIKSL